MWNSTRLLREVESYKWSGEKNLKITIVSWFSSNFKMYFLSKVQLRYSIRCEPPSDTHTRTLIYYTIYFGSLSCWISNEHILYYKKNFEFHLTVRLYSHCIAAVRREDVRHHRVWRGADIKRTLKIPSRASTISSFAIAHNRMIVKTII